MLRHEVDHLNGKFVTSEKNMVSGQVNQFRNYVSRVAELTKAPLSDACRVSGSATGSYRSVRICFNLRLNTCSCLQFLNFPAFSGNTLSILLFKRVLL